MFRQAGKGIDPSLNPNGDMRTGTTVTSNSWCWVPSPVKGMGAKSTQTQSSGSGIPGNLPFSIFTYTTR